MYVGCVCVTFLFVFAHILNVLLGTKVQNGPIKECSNKCTKCYWGCTFCACACGTFSMFSLVHKCKMSFNAKCFNQRMFKGNWVLRSVCPHCHYLTSLSPRGPLVCCWCLTGPNIRGKKKGNRSLYSCVSLLFEQIILQPGKAQSFLRFVYE